MSLNIAPKTVYPVGDKSFTDRKEAVAYGTLLKRIENLKLVDFTKTGHAYDVDADTVVSLSDLPSLIASLGDSVQEALAVKQFTRTKKEAV
jgi:hypothetical protein